MIQDRTLPAVFGRVVIYAIVIALGLACLLPLLNITAVSLSASDAVSANRVGIFPVGFNLGAYRKMVTDGQLWRSFAISVLRAVLSLVIHMTLIVSMAYPLSKNNRRFPGRNIYMKFMVFAMLFNGGLIPTYMVVNFLKLTNTIWALVLPGAVPIFNVILVMNFFAGIPSSLEEAAIMDGAGPMTVLLRIFVPCSLPALATVALFSIVGSWNDFFGGLVYMSKMINYPLMTYIQTLTIDLVQLMNSGAGADELAQLAEVSNRNLNAAKIVLAAAPLLVIYPFLQKYFVSGIVMGAVKE
ncbi:MAG: carbohydrate ABC transporter permease [Clostridiales bacterium]|jgi:putative aldouronate transport system permease protein|nr:carbohydrate ABC transporter permease [Clostridiales bacterium]